MSAVLCVFARVQATMATIVCKQQSLEIRRAPSSVHSLATALQLYWVWEGGDGGGGGGGGGVVTETQAKSKPCVSCESSRGLAAELSKHQKRQNCDAVTRCIRWANTRQTPGNTRQTPELGFSARSTRRTSRIPASLQLPYITEHSHPILKELTAAS